MAMGETELYEIAYDLYGKVFEGVSGETLNDKVDTAICETVDRMSGMVSNEDELKKYLMSRISREKEEDTVSVMLGEEAENSTWWDDFKEENPEKLNFWNRYSNYLFSDKHWEKSAIKKSIGHPTDMLLNAIADPNKAIAQQKRAMVVGYVQSGKTANYIGLINKAIDAGYKYIIVLAGIHNNLRSQTQSRIDEEVLGYETDSEARQKQRERAETNKIGVGKKYKAGFVQTLTFRDEKGDFSKGRSGIQTAPDIPTIIVTKKIKSTLTNLIENIESSSEISKDEKGQFYLRAKYPLLLIDDTMLIHVARIKNMHNQLARRVREYFFDELEPMIIDGDKATKDEILNLIREDYVPVTEEMQRDFEKYMEGSDIIPEDEIYNEILRLVGEEKIRINVINGDSQDVLSYKDHEGEEYNVIAIGGDKFSRGLTLEGLSISYFTRESKYYDTLMQMGRWFGFRPKYADLCRVFITEDIYRWFARIAFATDDLRQQITYMCDENAKPKDFGLRVATHPELKISSPRKVKSGTMQRLNFSNTLTVTRDIDVDIDQYNTNYDAVNHLFAYASKIYSSAEHFEKLGRKTDNDHLFLEEVESSKIVEFFRTFNTSKYANKVNGNNIATYIEEQNKDQLLTKWTVCLINTGSDNPGFEIAGHHVKNGITRNGENSVIPLKDGKVCSLHMLKSKGHEYFALDRDAYEEALRMESDDDKGDYKSIAEHIRSKMDPRKGLLLIYPIDHRNGSQTKNFAIGDGNHQGPIGLVVVFPEGNGKSVSYQVNQIGIKGEINDFFD